MWPTHSSNQQLLIVLKNSPLEPKQYFRLPFTVFGRFSEIQKTMFYRESQSGKTEVRTMARTLFLAYTFFDSFYTNELNK